MRAEEAHLREKFGDAYDRYARASAPPGDAALQLGAGAAQSRAPRAGGPAWPGSSLLALKVWYSQGFVAYR